MSEMMKLAERVEGLEGPDANRFMAKVRKESDCWLWVGAKRGSRQKRGCFWDGKKNVDSARWIFQQMNPLVDIENKVVRHKCDNPLCVNPDHLLPGTQAENVADMWERKRANVDALLAAGRKGMAKIRSSPEFQVRGERHGLYGKGHKGEKNGISKLTEKSVREIRALSGVLPQREIAAKFGVHQGVIHRVIKRKAWAHVE